jgi:hypothetical protein
LGVIIVQAIAESNHALAQQFTQPIGELKDQVTQLMQRLEEQQRAEDSAGVPLIRPRRRTDLELVAEIREAMRDVAREEVGAQPARGNWWPWKR